MITIVLLRVNTQVNDKDQLLEAGLKEEKIHFLLKANILMSNHFQ